MLGLTVSHYRITGKLGTGGMGVVYDAEDLKLPRKVALKFLPDGLADDQDAVRRFAREASTIALLSHPNICTIYDVDTHEGRQFIAMERVPGVTLKTIMAVLRARRGRITWNGDDITALPPYRIVQLGIGYVPEERRIFPNLSVYENLKMARLTTDGGRHMDAYLARVLELFPPLAERLASKGKTLSGGEQQMLTMARSLGTNPKLLLIDEPTEGLMPAFVETIGRTITEIQRQGVAVLLVEQNTRLALEATQRVYVIEKGMIKHEARSIDLASDAEARRRYLGV